MNTTPNPTAEDLIAEALQDMWPDSTLFGDPWSPESHEVISIASKLRAHGLLSEGAPSEEQIERAAEAMQAESSGFFSMEAWRHLARVGLTAAGAAQQEPSTDEQRGFIDAVEGALCEVEGRHHIIGDECLCGEKRLIKNRDKTKHIARETIAALMGREVLNELSIV